MLLGATAPARLRKSETNSIIAYVTQYQLRVGDQPHHHQSCDEEEIWVIAEWVLFITAAAAASQLEYQRNQFMIIIDLPIQAMFL